MADKRRTTPTRKGRNSSDGKGRSTSTGSRRGPSKSRDRRPRAEPTPPRAERSGWGSVAQHGAAGATHGQKLSEIEAAGERFSPEEQAKFQVRQAKRERAAERLDDLRGEAKRAIDRSASSKSTPSDSAAYGAHATVERSPLPSRPPRSRDVAKELVKAHGKQRGERSWKLFRRAAREFDEDQFQDGCRSIKPLVESNPDIAEMRELYGVALYRLGKWELAVEQLEAFRVLSGTTEQNPVLMDAHRALGNWSDVDDLWRELAEASPSGELIAEGRIVRAGADADRGEIDAAIRVLEKGWKVPREPREHHLRRAYVLADLFERAGKLPKSRRLFEWIAQHEPDFGDIEDRVRRLH